MVDHERGGDGDGGGADGRERGWSRPGIKTTVSYLADVDLADERVGGGVEAVKFTEDVTHVGARDRLHRATAHPDPDRELDVPGPCPGNRVQHRVCKRRAISIQSASGMSMRAEQSAPHGRHIYF